MQLEPINMLWVGPTLRQLEQQCIASFLVVGHPVSLYCYETPVGVPPGVTLCDASRILPADRIFTYQRGSGAGSYAAFANLFRYKLLYDEGGWWSDTDVYCLRPWIFTTAHVFVREPMAQPLVHNGVIRAPAASPIMGRAYKLASAANPKTMVWGQTGSRLLTALLHADTRTTQECLYPARTFCPIAWSNIPAAVHADHLPLSSTNVFGVHLFREMWRRHKLDVENPTICRHLAAHVHKTPVACPTPAICDKQSACRACQRAGGHHGR